MENLLNILRNAKKNGYQYVSTNADNDLMIEDVIADVNASEVANTGIEYEEMESDTSLLIFSRDSDGSRSAEAIYKLTK